MNQRLTELYRSCRSKEGLASQDEYKSANALLGTEVEKFAELIVKECVVCAEREWIRNGDTEHNRAVTKVIGSIKQHFGVEE